MNSSDVKGLRHWNIWCDWLISSAMRRRLRYKYYAVDIRVWVPDFVTDRPKYRRIIGTVVTTKNQDHLAKLLDDMYKTFHYRLRSTSRIPMRKTDVTSYMRLENQYMLNTSDSAYMGAFLILPVSSPIRGIEWSMRWRWMEWITWIRSWYRTNRGR